LVAAVGVKDAGGQAEQGVDVALVEQLAADSLASITLLPRHSERNGTERSRVEE